MLLKPKTSTVGLSEHAAALLAAPPAIERIDVLAAKLP